MKSHTLTRSIVASDSPGHAAPTKLEDRDVENVNQRRIIMLGDNPIYPVLLSQDLTEARRFITTSSG